MNSTIFVRIVLTLFLLTPNYLLSENSCDKVKWIVGDGTRENPLTYNGKWGDDFACHAGTAYDCTKVCTSVEDVSITDHGNNTATISGKMTSIDIIVTTSSGNPLNHTESAASVLIPDSHFIVTSSNSTFPIGTKIIVEEFTTGSDGSFSVTGQVE